jgi:hypothetical protein
MLAPSLTLLDFHLRRSTIERELCVQRDVAEVMRTCHGECQLSKRLKALEQEAERGFPVEDLRFREYPMVVDGVPDRRQVPATSTSRFVLDRSAKAADGYGRSPEHVPWC